MSHICEDGEHVWAMFEGYEKCCEECGLVDTKFRSYVNTNPYDSCLMRPEPNHSRKKYFLKTLEIYIGKPGTYINTLERCILERDFEIQEKVLERALKRKKSINVWYKLYKLLQHGGVKVNRENFLLPSDKKIKEYE